MSGSALVTLTSQHCTAELRGAGSALLCWRYHCPPHAVQHWVESGFAAQCPESVHFRVQQGSGVRLALFKVEFESLLRLWLWLDLSCIICSLLPVLSQIDRSDLCNNYIQFLLGTINQRHDLPKVTWKTRADLGTAVLSISALSFCPSKARPLKLKLLVLLFLVHLDYLLHSGEPASYSYLIFYQ